MPARRRTRSAQGSFPAAARRGAKTLGGGKSRPASKRVAAGVATAVKDRARRRPAKLGARAMPSAVQKHRDISATKRRQRQAQQLKKFRAARGTRAKDRARRRG